MYFTDMLQKCHFYLKIISQVHRKLEEFQRVFSELLFPTISMNVRMCKRLAYLLLLQVCLGENMSGKACFHLCSWNLKGDMPTFNK